MVFKVETLTSAINVQVDARDKEQATNILDGKRTGYNNVNEMLKAIIDG